MSDEKIVKTDLGLADKLSMDDFVRTVVAQMFENDNDITTLEVTLNVPDAKKPPKLEIEMRLVSINGQKVRSEDSV